MDFKVFDDCLMAEYIAIGGISLVNSHYRAITIRNDNNQTIGTIKNLRETY